MNDVLVVIRGEVKVDMCLRIGLDEMDREYVIYGN